MVRISVSHSIIIFPIASAATIVAFNAALRGAYCLPDLTTTFHQPSYNCGLKEKHYTYYLIKLGKKISHKLQPQTP